MNMLDLLFGQQKIGTPGINPNAPDPRPDKPANPLDAFLNKPGGSMLMNLLAQSGRSLTPGPTPLGAVGRAALTTQQQQRQSGMDDLQRRLIEARISGRIGGAEDPSIVRTFKHFESLGDPKNPDTLTEAQKRFLAVQRSQQIEDIPGLGLNRVLPTGIEQIAGEPTIVGGIEGRSGAAERGKQEAAIAAIPQSVSVRAQSEAATRLPSELASLDSIIAASDRVIEKIEDIMPLTEQAGIPVAVRGDLPGGLGGDPRRLKQEATSLKANFGFDTLQKMRNASKTGGALGQVSERELDLLINALQAIDVEGEPEALQQNLRKVAEHYQNYKREIEIMKNIMREQAGQAPVEITNDFEGFSIATD